MNKYALIFELVPTNDELMYVLIMNYRIMSLNYDICLMNSCMYSIMTTCKLISKLANVCYLKTKTLRNNLTEHQ